MPSYCWCSQFAKLKRRNNIKVKRLNVMVYGLTYAHLNAVSSNQHLVSKLHRLQCNLGNCGWERHSHWRKLSIIIHYAYLQWWPLLHHQVVVGCFDSLNVIVLNRQSLHLCLFHCGLGYKAVIVGIWLTHPLVFWGVFHPSLRWVPGWL